ncbi:tetratricopeptide repeat protein [Kitasatospora sp. NPDC059571]|uniref:tetratricopeptide repeat protein n=1 Tax=Kitasatospora sp. NPDC059571 TaxID=3346871 RepID=UPI0036CA94D4
MPDRHLPARRRPRLRGAVAASALGAALFLAGAVGLPAQTPTDGGAPTAAGAGAGAGAGDSLTTDIGRLQAHLRDTPGDAEALAALGLDYVQQAKNTADPSYYPRAEEVLRRSLSAEPADNFTALGGMAALAAGRHAFADALDWAQRAVAVNPYNSALYGTLADAYTQLGRYDEAADAVQRMVDLRPGAPSLSRASYVAELRGDTATARADMARALQDAAGPADRAFAHYYLAQLAFGSGDAAGALAEAQAGLRESPTHAGLLEARALARAALGDTASAVEDLTAAVRQVPAPQYVLELGDLYRSLGRTAEAAEQDRVFRAEQQLFTANGVALDADAALFEADHGDPARALEIATGAVASRPFVESHDALAWALHINGRDAEALAESDLALAPGLRSALFHYHRAQILAALGDGAGQHDELARALAINPHFHPVWAPRAREEMGGR